MPDTATSPMPSPLPPDALGAAQALAPVNNEPDYQSLVTSPEFRIFLNKIGDFAMQQANSERQWARRRNTVKLRKMILGESYGLFDKRRGWVNKKEEGDGIYYDSTVATFIDILVSQLVKSRPKKVCVARVPDRVDKREAARVAEKLLELDDDQDFTPKRQQREWKWNLLCGGETYRITYFDSAKAGCGVNEDKFEPVMVEGGDEAYYCPLCDATTVNDEGKCVSCGNPQVDKFQAKDATITVKKETQYKQIGDVNWEVPDCLEMTVFGETDEIAEALVVSRDRIIPRCVLQDALGKENLPDTDTPLHLQYKQLFNDSRGQSDETMPEFKLLHYQELWVSPAVYSAYKLPTETQTKGGQKAPAGSSLKEICPKGFYFSRVKDDIQNFWPQATIECLSHAVNAVSDGFHGQGEWDLNELGDQLQEAKSMEMNSLMLDSTQPLLIEEGTVDSESFENKFGLVLTVPKAAVHEKGLSGNVHRVPASSLPDQAYTMSDKLKGETQQRAGAFSTSSDAPDVEAMGTATGVNTLLQQSVGRRSPALELYAQMEIDQAYQKLELRQKHWCEKMYSAIATDLGDDAVKWFMRCNIRQDINIKVVENSWMPQTREQRQVGLMSYLNAVGELVMAKNDPDLLNDIIKEAGEVFGFGLDIGDYQAENVEARLRLDALKDVSAFIEQTFGDALYDEMGEIIPEAVMLAYNQAADMLKLVHMRTDETDIFYNLPIDVMFDDHKECEDAYTDWLKTAEGRAASLFARTLVRELAEYHIQAEAYRMLKLNTYSKVPQVADLEAEAIANEVMQPPPDTSAEDAQAADTAKMDAQTNAKREEQLLNLGDKERQREHELEMQDKSQKMAKAA